MGLVITMHTVLVGFVGQSDSQYPRKMDLRNLYCIHYTGNLSHKQRLWREICLDSGFRRNDGIR